VKICVLKEIKKRFLGQDLGWSDRILARGQIYAGKEPKGQWKFWGQEVSFGTKFLKSGPKEANLVTLGKSVRTVSRELYLEKRVYLGLTSYG